MNLQFKDIKDEKPAHSCYCLCIIKYKDERLKSFMILPFEYLFNCFSVEDENIEIMQFAELPTV